MGEMLGNWRRSFYCGQVDAELLNREVCVFGWVKKRRNLGGMLFIDLRDRSGYVQLLVTDSAPEALRREAEKLRSEYVVAAKGILRRRAAVNPNIPTGLYEIELTEIRILSSAETPPFAIDDAEHVSEALRLKYRFLDLRREELQKNLRLRSKLIQETVNYFAEQDFVNVETPYLGKSTPEGARDYLVPSRVYPGSFFALPQSPQLFKQILMISGVDRYFQIARCFRDEDLRADRQPEFTQVDVEMSFVGEEEVRTTAEGYVKRLFAEFCPNLPLPAHFPVISYAEAMRRFGSDKPDVRFGMELHDLTEMAAQLDFPVFREALAAGGSVQCICLPDGGSMTRKEIDRLAEIVKLYKAKGLAWVVPAAEPRSSFNKFLTPEWVAALKANLGAKDGDLILLVADQTKTCQVALGQLRLSLAKQFSLIPDNSFGCLWVNEFPLFEYSEEEQRFTAVHHPFTAIMEEDIPYLESDPGRCRAKAYDFVVNGQEMGGGSIRIHDRDFQKKVLGLLGFSEESAEENFGFLLRAFDYGVPPHGGIAFGLDRWVMLFAKTMNIRDVIAFPKVQSSACLMTEAPSRVSAAQLAELELRVPEVQTEGGQEQAESVL